MSLPIEGNHTATLAGQIVIYTTGEGATCAAIPVKLTSGDVAWAGKYTATLVKKDGQVQERRIKEMKTIFGDPLDPASKVYRFEEDPEVPIGEIPAAQAITFEVVGEHRQIQPEDGGEPYWVFSIKWINPQGGGMQMPQAVSRKDFLAKHGAKLRAFGLGTPAPAAAKATPATVQAPAPATPATPAAQPELPAAQSPAAAPKKGPGRPPKAATPPKPADPVIASTSEEVWERLQALRPDLDEAGQSEVWYAAQQEIAGRQDNELTPAQWGAVKVKLEKEFAK